jgi:hypothetical protein
MKIGYPSVKFAWDIVSKLVTPNCINISGRIGYLYEAKLNYTILHHLQVYFVISDIKS